MADESNEDVPSYLWNNSPSGNFPDENNGTPKKNVLVNGDEEVPHYLWSSENNGNNEKELTDKEIEEQQNNFIGPFAGSAAVGIGSGLRYAYQGAKGVLESAIANANKMNGPSVNNNDSKFFNKNNLFSSENPIEFNEKPQSNIDLMINGSKIDGVNNGRQNMSFNSETQRQSLATKRSLAQNPKAANAIIDAGPMARTPSGIEIPRSSFDEINNQRILNEAKEKIAQQKILESEKLSPIAHAAMSAGSKVSDIVGGAANGALHGLNALGQAYSASTAPDSVSKALHGLSSLGSLADISSYLSSSPAIRSSIRGIAAPLSSISGAGADLYDIYKNKNYEDLPSSLASLATSFIPYAGLPISIGIRKSNEIQKKWTPEEKQNYIDSIARSN